MFEDSKLGTVLLAGGAIFLVFFIVFLWLLGWGFYLSSAIGMVAAVILIWWMGVEDAETVDDTETLAGPSRGNEAAPVEVTPDPQSQEIAEPQPEAPPREKPEPQPDPEPSGVEVTADAQGERPQLQDNPDGEADDLKKIKGIGPKLEALLNEMGVWHFSQIANWSEAEIVWVDDNLEGFSGRITRDDWVGQAKDLARA